MTGVLFWVPGKPYSKARARTLKSGHSYTPKTTVQWEKQVAAKAREAMRDLPPFEGDVKVELSFSGAAWNADLDNLSKACLDAMNRIVYRDDRQVQHLTAQRISGAPAGVCVEVWAHDGDSPALSSSTNVGKEVVTG